MMETEFYFAFGCVQIVTLFGECFAEKLFFCYNFKSPYSKLLDFSKDSFNPIYPTSALLFDFPNV